MLLAKAAHVNVSNSTRQCTEGFTSSTGHLGK
jgi:hypothetical protein